MKNDSNANKRDRKLSEKLIELNESPCPTLCNTSSSPIIDLDSDAKNDMNKIVDELCRGLL